MNLRARRTKGDKYDRNRREVVQKFDNCPVASLIGSEEQLYLTSPLSWDIYSVLSAQWTSFDVHTSGTLEND